MNWTNGKVCDTPCAGTANVLALIDDQKVPERHVKTRYNSTRHKKLVVERPKEATRAAFETDDDSKKSGVLLQWMTSPDSEFIP